ncbi:MAG: FAD-dependent oxidoreductase [Alphaproteobacteria bacterium]|nr:FAD-dependent oxidoreductase [Alphaproteobacteria bacterium]
MTGAREISVRCCIVGGGPAGMMLGFLLARAGIPVLLLEKHADFLRDFRGDTIHPSTLELMHELGLLDEFLRRPHQEVHSLGAQIGEEFLQVADFTHLPTRCRFVALMPQWDFLDFLAEHAKRFPVFQLKMQAEAHDLMVENGTVAGVLATTPDREISVKADLVVAADGRHSTLRQRAGLDVLDVGAPMDVLWMRLSRHSNDPAQTLGRIDAGRIFVMLNREEYWQCAYVISKGRFGEIRGRGLPALREEITGLAPYLRDRVDELKQWSDVKLLSVSVDRLRVWHRRGLLCIGDAAHAMSPIGGVGINLAIQDAVAAANILSPRFLNGSVTQRDLEAVQRRRDFPTRATQRLQVAVQNRVIDRVLTSTAKITPPLAMRVLDKVPFLRRIPARLIGLGFRPEHVSAPVAG